jgi:blue copper oxidase
MCVKRSTSTILLLLVQIALQAQESLYIPPVLSGTSFNLNVQAGTTQFFKGVNTPTFGVNGSFLAPTLIINKGDIITLNVTNNLPNSTTTMHWHGFHVAAVNDGGPHQTIAKGTTWSPSFKMLNAAGTYWYHPHGENKTDIQVSKGIAGLIIVKDTIENALILPRQYGVDDIPLIVQTKAFDILKQIASASMLDTFTVVNGIHNGYFNVPAQVVRLRLLNGASERSFYFAFSNHMNFYQIATDGGLMDAPVKENRLRLSPGERAEVLVNFQPLLGDSVYLMSYGSELPHGIIGADSVGIGADAPHDYYKNPLNGADFKLLKFIIKAPTSNPVTSIPSALTKNIPWSMNSINATRTLVLAPKDTLPETLAEGPFTINGLQFNMDSINIKTYLNNTEIWTIDNKTQVAHPIHIHNMHFFITEVNGGPVPEYEQGKKDVVLVMPMQKLKFITKFEDFASPVPYMYHCHLLHHEDEGMMGSFVVLDTNSSGINKIPTTAFTVYPNPASNFIHIHKKVNELVIEKIEITDVLGKVVLTLDKNDANNLSKINISSFPSGHYFIQLVTESSLTTIRLLKQ